MVQQWKNKVEQLKKQLGNADVLNQREEEKIVLISQQLKDSHIASKASSFLDLTYEDLK